MSPRGVLLRLAIAAGVAVAVGAPSALAGTSQTPIGEQTHPRVAPPVGGRHRTFELSFTLAQTLSSGPTEHTDYRAVVSAPAHARAACLPTQPAPVATGTRGEVKRTALHPPAHGWCGGRYAVTVYLQVITVCGPPLDPRPEMVCPVVAREAEPAFPAGNVNTGDTHFTVR